MLIQQWLANAAILNTPSSPRMSRSLTANSIASLDGLDSHAMDHRHSYQVINSKLSTSQAKETHDTDDLHRPSSCRPKGLRCQEYGG